MVTQVVNQLVHVSDLLNDLSGRLRSSTDPAPPLNININLNLVGNGEFSFLALFSSPDGLQEPHSP
jgi:hypothetical protein